MPPAPSHPTLFHYFPNSPRGRHEVKLGCRVAQAFQIWKKLYLNFKTLNYANDIIKKQCDCKNR